MRISASKLEMRLITILLGLSMAICALEAQTTTLPTVQVRELELPHLSSPPKLADFVGGTPRTDLKRIDDFRQRNPGDGAPASRRTTAFLGYDDNNLYAVFVCESPAGQTRARVGKREDVFSDDIVGLVLDTFHDRQHGSEFFVNAYGVQADATLSDGGRDNFSFDTVWRSEGRATANGFAALIAVPFRSLRFTYADMQTWGLGLARFVPALNEQDFWPYITNRINSFLPQLGTATGLGGISPGRNLQLIPYASFAHAHFLDNPAAGPLFRATNDTRVGLDAKAVIRDALTLDVALNPDFSQVESDDPQVTVNQRFEVFFPEKRPFFLENTGYFATPENLVFSRRIRDPEFGVRLTGKLGRWNLGVLGADDRAPGRLEDPSDPLNGKRARIAIGRVQREFAKESSAGVLMTDREFGGGYNRVEAADLRLKLGPVWRLEGQAIWSQTKATGGTETSGTAFNFGINRFSRTLGYNLNYQDRGAGFHTDLGFVPRVDIRQVNQFARRVFYLTNRRAAGLISVRTNMFANAVFDRAGRQQEWVANPNLNFEFARSTFIGSGFNRGFERFNNLKFRNGGWFLFANSDYFKKAGLEINLEKNNRINYDPAAGLEPFRGDWTALRSNVTLRPGSRIKLQEIYSWSHLKSRDDSFVANTTPVARPTTVFVNHLIRSKLNYQFNRELSLRLIVDYNATLPNSSLSTLTRTKQITSDILLTWLLNPGTAFYVGYTDRLENLGISAGTPAELGRLEFPSTTTSRQLFVKLSYLFRF